ncbi:hypothetical protein [Phytobacter sp. V91]|uniref:hypothetical protein n=1 Tax=Phytobacter sp. V91 TaxID=3369425 RepID=UPI003F637E60
MLALPFDLMFMEKEPVYAVLIAAFGPVPALLFFGSFLQISWLKWLSAVCAAAIAIAWFPGAGMTIIMMFSGISGVKIFLCWLVMLTGILSFVVFNHRHLAVIYHEYNVDDKPGKVVAPGRTKKRSRRR